MIIHNKGCYNSAAYLGDYYPEDESQTRIFHCPRGYSATVSGPIGKSVCHGPSHLRMVQYMWWDSGGKRLTLDEYADEVLEIVLDRIT